MTTGRICGVNKFQSFLLMLKLRSLSDLYFSLVRISGVIDSSYGLAQACACLDLDPL